MAFTIHRQRQISSRARVFLGGLGAGLLGLLLAAPLSWAQIGAVPPAPPSIGFIIWQVNYIDPASNELFDRDCLRMDRATWTFTSDRFNAQRGFWYAAGQPDLFFTAHITVDGQPVPLTISYGGLLDPNGGITTGTLVSSNGTEITYKVAYVAQVNPNCSLPSSPSQLLEEVLRGYGN
jgi:hypothetical protein